MNVLTNAKDWIRSRIEGYLIKKGVVKAVAGVTAGAIALWASLQTNATVAKAQVAIAWLNAHGVHIEASIDQAQLNSTLTVLFTGLATMLLNFLFRSQPPKQ